MLKFLPAFGVMRVVLLLFTLVAIALVPFTDMQPQGLGVIPAYIAPTAAVLLFFVLLLDALMNRVFMSGTEASAQRMLRLRMRSALVAVTLLVLAWTPYFQRLLNSFSDT